MSTVELFDSIKVENLAVLGVDVFRGKQRVRDYVDTATGQVIPSDTAYAMGVRAIRGDARARRQMKLDSLRPEPRQFALFLLRFRDAHCKFLMPMNILINWFSTLHSRQRYHVKRYFRPLIEAGILDSENTLNEDFMVHNRAAGKETSKGDEVRAYRLYEDMRLRHKELKAPSTSQPTGPR